MAHEYASGGSDDDDGFDPAFADHDLHHQQGNSSLGASFGSSLGNSLGAGFGTDLSELDGSFEGDSWADQLGSGSLVSSSLGAGFGRQKGEEEFDSASSSPLRRSRGASSGGGGSNHRQSLAFELASASGPNHASRDLMRELGIEEEEADEQDVLGVKASSGSGNGAYESSSEEEGQVMYGQAVGGSEEEEEEQEETEDNGHTPRPGSRISHHRVISGSYGAPSSTSSPGRIRLRHNAPSTDSLRSASYHQQVPPEPRSPSPGQREEDLDALIDQSTKALESSLEATGSFLRHLRQHATGETAETNGKEECGSSTLDYSDRQPVMETLASAVIKSMIELAKERENQIRELTELDRIASKTPLRRPSTLPSDPRLHDIDIPFEDDNIDPSATFSSPPLSPSTVTFDPQARVELSSLRDITASLITALSAINEVTQVNRASVSEAGRKLKALRGHLVVMKEDMLSLARSERYIEEYEKKQVKKGGYSEQAREAMVGAQRALDEGWERAKEVLATA